MRGGKAVVWFDLAPELVGKPSHYQHYTAILLVYDGKKYDLPGKEVRSGQKTIEAAIEAIREQLDLDLHSYQGDHPAQIDGFDVWQINGMNSVHSNGTINIGRNIRGIGLFNGGYRIPTDRFANPELPRTLSSLIVMGDGKTSGMPPYTIPQFVNKDWRDYMIKIDPKYINGRQEAPISWMTQVHSW